MFPILVGGFAGILLALGFYVLHKRFWNHFPKAAMILGMLLGGITTYVCTTFLGPYTGELHGIIFVLLGVYWGTNLVIGLYHAYVQRVSPLRAVPALVLLESIALGVLLLVEKLTELAFYRGAEDESTWMLARDTLHLGQQVFLGALLILVLAAPWLSSRKAPKPG